MDKNKLPEDNAPSSQTPKKRPPALPAAAVVSLAASVLIGGGCAAAFLITRYLPFALLGVLLMMPVLVNAALLLPRVIPSPSAAIKITSAAAALCFFAGAAGWILLQRRMTSLYALTFLWPAALLVLFVVFIILDKWCRHSVTDDGFSAALLRNLRSVFIALRLSVLPVTAAAVIRLLGFADLQKYLVWVLDAVYVYVSAFLFITFIARVIRRELISAPDISIPMPFVSRDSRDLGVISYLEENTGITMRSLWSIRLIRGLLPYMLLTVFLLLWAVTGIVQIDPDSRGALYVFGRLDPEPLEPGLHLTLPYPFARVTVYNTDAVRRVTIGYSSDENTDNIWTAAHGTGEFKLLLGGGSELVSINLRIEYRISDLIAYLRSSSSPEKLLQALAYGLITDRTITTDLENLMSVDREAFAGNFADELSALIGEYDTGLEIVSVVMESIHPPVDVAEKYQQLIGAGIRAERTILQAETAAARTVAAAEARRDTTVNAANADNFSRVAEAQAAVAEFMAGVEADNAYSDAYRYGKYLNAVSRAYGNARLVIVGPDVDTSRLYFGSISAQ